MLPILSLSKREELEYDIVDSLGHGSYGNVLEVAKRSDRTRFAMKIIRSPRRTRDVDLEILQEELKAIQALQHHHHFIQVYAAYEAPMEVGLVTWPVADRRSLAHCLDEYLTTSSGVVRTALQAIFYRAFGCLAESLAWMHEQRFRHKDIKPANILIHQGQILCMSTIPSQFQCNLTLTECRLRFWSIPRFPPK